MKAVLIGPFGIKNDLDLLFWRYITSCLACMEIDIKENNFLQKIGAHVSRHVE